MAPKKRPPPTLLGVGYPAAKDEARSRTMSRIRSKDTGIELTLRKALWRAGLRYRLHHRKLPGSPDLVLANSKVAVFCDSSFWHGRDTAKVEGIKTNTEYWRRRIALNVARDRAADAALQSAGWQVIRLWDDEIATELPRCVETVLAAHRARRPGRAIERTYVREV